jgi:hypothetical protein
MDKKPTARRGRPPKFGRPAQLLTLTLPVDVVEGLKRLDPDPAWAVVKLFERAGRKAGPLTTLADLAHLPGRRALILVRPEAFHALPGVSIIPLADGRGFLALESGRGLADLEVAVMDRLEMPSLQPDERAALGELRRRLRMWRQEGLRFESRSILVAERTAAPTRTAKPLTEIGEVRKARRANGAA